MTTIKDRLHATNAALCNLSEVFGTSSKSADDFATAIVRDIDCPRCLTRLHGLGGVLAHSWARCTWTRIKKWLPGGEETS